MRVISFAALRNFIDIHADAEQPLREWYKQVNKAYWRNLSDMRKTFRTVDYVGNDRYVFTNKNGTAHRVAVTLGQRFDDRIEIIPVIPGDLKEGDQLVTTGQARLVDGAKLEIVKGEN